MAESNEALVRRFFDTLNAEDLEGLKPMFHPDATWTPMTQMDIPGAAVHRGRVGIVDEFLKPVRGLFVGKDPQNQINSLVAQGNLVALETHGTGKLTKIGPDLGNAMRGFKKAFHGEDDEKKAAASSEKLQADPPAAAGAAQQEQRDSAESKHAP